MGKLTLILAFLLVCTQWMSFANKGVPLNDSASRFTLHVDYQGFFDNREFTNIQNQIPTTFFGQRFQITTHICVDSSSKLIAGLTTLQEFGSPSLFSFNQSTLFFERKIKNHYFLLGSFPRTSVLPIVPRTLFSDTIAYYHPNMTGLSYTYKNRKIGITSWLDWTSQKTLQQREHFHLGFLSTFLINPFELRVYSNLSHLAHTAGQSQKPLEESLMNQVELRFFNYLDNKLGWQTNLSLLHSIERVRDGSPIRQASSILIENILTYKHAEMNFVLKRGAGHFTYSIDPFYQYTNYARLDMKVNASKIKNTSIQGIYSLHFVEKDLVHQQKIAIFTAF